jgi:hypothetical protein
MYLFLLISSSWDSPRPSHDPALDR